jgi:hypothetical protein
MNAARAFVAGRGAIPVSGPGSVSEWLGRGHSYVYTLIGRGELRQIGPGRVTADSLIEFYERHDKEVVLSEKNQTSGVVPVATHNGSELHREIDRLSAVTGRARISGGAR